MGVRIIEGVKLHECDAPAAVLYCSTTGTAFGPVFRDAIEADDFLSWCRRIHHVADVQKLDIDVLVGLYGQWMWRRQAAGALVAGK